MKKMYLVLGDWSDDGHGKYEKILMESNLSVLEVQEAYKKACEITGIEFNHNEDYTKRNRDWKKRADYQVCVDYEDSELKPKVKKILIKYGIKVDMDNENWFTDLWIDFVKIARPDLELKRADKTKDFPVINGYWNKNLNVGFGYGLFH